MSDNGIKAFQQSAQEASLWIKEICEEMGDPRHQIAYQAMRGVLFAVRDRLPPSEAVQLASQLPLLVRGIYFEGYRLAGKPTLRRAVVQMKHKLTRELGRWRNRRIDEAREGARTVKFYTGSPSTPSALD